MKNARLEEFPLDVRPVIKVLYDWEDSLSDGFGYYMQTYDYESDDGSMKQGLIDLAHEIIEAVKTGETK